MVLMDTVANACETGEVEIEPEARHLPKNISGTAPPSKQELVVNTGPGLTGKTLHFGCTKCELPACKCD